jgi:hypothetical protein
MLYRSSMLTGDHLTQYLRGLLPRNAPDVVNVEAIVRFRRACQNRPIGHRGRGCHAEVREGLADGGQWYGMFILFIPVYVFLFLPMRMVLIGETDRFLPAVGTLHWGLMTTVFSLSHLAYLLTLPASGNPNGGGPSLALYLVLLTLAAYLLCLSSLKGGRRVRG